VKSAFAQIIDANKKYDFITPDHISIKNPAIPTQTISLNAGTDYDAVVSGVPTAVGDKSTKFYVR